MWRALLSQWEACSPVEPEVSIRTAGIPPRFRGRAWPFLIGNAMRISPEIYDICIGRARKLRTWQSVQSGMARMSEYSVGGAGSGLSHSVMTEAAMGRRRREDSMDSLPDLMTIGTSKLGREDTLSVRCCCRVVGHHAALLPCLCVLHQVVSFTVLCVFSLVILCPIALLACACGLARVVSCIGYGAVIQPCSMSRDWPSVLLL